MSDHKFWLGFTLVPEIGPKRIALLLDYFGNLVKAWNAPEADLARSGLDRHCVVHVLRAREKIDLDNELAKVERTGAQLVILTDANYPTLLKKLPDAPPVLYVRGQIIPEDERALSLVGTRKATNYGREVAYHLAKELAANNVTVVSGLAHGIDSAAHRGALDGGGRTIAVLGCGINQIYPRDNQPLATDILRSGAVISEFPIGVPPEARNFPRRNRVVSGLSLGVLVVEAPEKSGALITASIAADQGREVFAIPANIFNTMGTGSNRLIQDGAKLVMTVGDILEELNVVQDKVKTSTVTERIVPANPTEAQLVKCLGVDPLHIDEIVRLCGLSVATVSSTLTILELKGLARMVGHMQYCLVQQY